MLFAPIALALAGAPPPATAEPVPPPPQGAIAGVPTEIAQAIWQIELHRLEPDALGAWVTHPVPAVRARVALALGRLRTDAALPSLEPLAADADASVREEAAFALGQTPGAGPLLGRRWAVEADRQV